MEKLISTIYLCGIFCFVLPVRSQNQYCQDQNNNQDYYQCNGAQEQNPTQPCAEAEDITVCIREYLKKVINCQDPTNIGNDVIVKDNVLRYLLSYNTTASQNLTITGLSYAKPESFIVDFTTNLMVLTTAFYNLTIGGPATYTYYQSNKEPKTLDSTGRGTFSVVRLGTVIRTATNPNLSDAFTVANLTEISNNTLGEGVENCKDADFLRLFAAIAEKPQTAEIEAFQTLSPLIANTYIRENLCNYETKQEEIK